MTRWRSSEAPIALISNPLRTAMPTASLAKAALSAVAVGMLLVLLRNAGPRAGGLAAAVPVNSLPALFWLWVEHGDAYAATVALGSLWCTGLTVLLGLVFARTALACHAALAALLAWLLVLALAAMTWTLPIVPAVAAALALIAILTGQAAPAHLPAGWRGRGDLRTGTLLSMVMAGAMSMLVSELSRHGGPRSCGLVAAIPVIGMSALHAAYRQGGAPVMFQVLGGYLDGMVAKSAFLGALGVSWAAGAGTWAWAMGLAVAGCALLAQRSLRQWRKRQLDAIAPGRQLQLLHAAAPIDREATAGGRRRVR